MEGLRGLAIALVFFVHFNTLFGGYFQTGAVSRKLISIAGAFGHTGVDLFFILSGFLIYGVIFRKKTSYLEYFVRRLERLHPTFLAVVGAYVLLSLAMPGKSRLPAAFGDCVLYLAANIAMLPGITNITPLITVAWSLSYEWFYYLTLPLVFFVLRMRRWTSGQRIAFFLLMLASIALFQQFGISPRFRRLALFLPGIVLWEVAYHQRAFVSRLTRWGEWIAAIAFVLNLSLIGLLNAGELALGPSASTSSLLYCWPLSVTGFFLVLYAMYYDGVLKRVFSLDYLRWMGNMSYSYYLVHGLAMHAVAATLLWARAPAPLPSPLGLGLLLACAMGTLLSGGILFLLVEKPMSLDSPGTLYRRLTSSARTA
ncbi:MAG: acyltransferase [Acidobacteria bacterium]|nr:acyltransferase [Acidobacteriota bacterium]